MIQEKRDFSKKIALLIFRYIIRYVQYFFLVTPVIFSFFILIFIITAIYPDAPLGVVFYYFSFINPAFGTGHLEGEILKEGLVQVFLVLSLIFLIIVDFFKFIIKKLFNKPFSVSLKQKMIISACLITAVYLVAFFTGLFSNSVEKEIEGIYVLITFYFINLFSVLIALIVNNFLNSVFGKLILEQSK